MQVLGFSLEQFIKKVRNEVCGKTQRLYQGNYEVKDI